MPSTTLRPTVSDHVLALNPVPYCSFFFIPQKQLPASHMKPAKTLSMRSSSKSWQCKASLSYTGEEYLHDKSRRSAEYPHPTVWNHQLIDSIQSPYIRGEFDARIQELKLEIKRLFTNASDDLSAMLELIDTIQRLGIAYHFKEEINDTLARVNTNKQFMHLHGLNETALCFRLLRQHSYNVSSDVFEKFRDGEGFMTCLSEDVKGLLSLYEATPLALPGEKILDVAKEFTVKHLERLISDHDHVDSNLVDQVKQSLEIPLYLSVPGLKARQYMEVYEREKGIITSCLLELAKLDFNVLQELHQREMKELSVWWQEVGLVEKLDCARDRLIEFYFLVNQSISEPKFSKTRLVLTKLGAIITVIDDFYDQFSTLDEAKLFTSAIKRLDGEGMEMLPAGFMNSCYMVVYNFVNETAYDILKDTGCDVKYFLKKEWTRLMEAYLKEAEWFHNGITPSLQKYLQNGQVSVAAQCLSVHAYYLIEENLRKRSLNWIDIAFEFIYGASLIIRLTDDLAPSKVEMQNKETSSAILCRMKDSGESYEASTKYIKDLVGKYLKELNKAALQSDLPRDYVDLVMKAMRMGIAFTRQGEDSFGTSSGITKDQIKSMFLEPIPME